jgi:hypothetical protein
VTISTMLFDSEELDTGTTRLVYNC